MRILAACSECKRQYEVRDLRPGQRFHCACGGLAVVPQHGELHRDALHCSGCGAGRQPGESACRFCQTAFAAEDLARSTVCPSCFSRITDAARFCDHCGTGIAAVLAAGEATRLTCPVCADTNLHHRSHGDEGTATDECPSCGGIWLDAARFEGLLAAAQAQVVPGAVANSTNTSIHARLPAQRGPLYRTCPVCATMMNRTNFALASGVIIDTCKQHGSWFDADELGRVLAFVRSGGMERARRRQESLDRGAELRRRERAAPVVIPAADAGDFGSMRSRGSGVDLVDVVTDLIGRLFR